MFIFFDNVLCTIDNWVYSYLQLKKLITGYIYNLKI